MSLQSMFNSMIGNIGVQSSILKNRLRDTSENAEPTKKNTKSKNASETAKKAPSNPSKDEPVKEAVEKKEAPQPAIEGLTGDKRKRWHAISTKDYKAFLRNQKTIETQRNQIAGLQERLKLIEEAK